jgi:hypothetical protein
MRSSISVSFFRRIHFAPPRHLPYAAIALPRHREPPAIIGDSAFLGEL